MKQNIVRTVFLVLILQGLAVPSDAQPTDSRSNPEDIVGIYGASDGLVSTEITLKSDGTFSFYGEGCVPPSVTEGTWHLVSPGLIVTNSEGSQPSSEIRAEIDSNRKKPRWLLCIVSVNSQEPLPSSNVRTEPLTGP